MQLHMVLSHERWPRARRAALPSGYLLRTFRDADRDGWIGLMRSAGFDGWSQESMRAALAQALQDGVFFVEHAASRELAATAMAGHRGTDLHPFGGELGWVAVCPQHRGKRLGTVVCAEVTGRLLAAGYREIYLQTDDWRLPAIRTYLDLGYVPLLCASDMEERWHLAAKNLSMRYEELGALGR